MNKELQEYYENYFDLISSPGWEQISKEVIEHISNLRTETLSQGDEKVFHYNRGYIDALNYIVNYENVIKIAYEELKNAPV